MNTRLKPRRVFRLPLTLGLLALGLTGVSGCNIVGPAVLLVSGPPKTEAMYELPADKPLVVFVDDRNSVLPSRVVRQRIAKAAEKTLVEGKALSVDLVNSDAILPVAAGERFTKPKSIAEVGKSVGAKTILYATVDAFTLSPNGAEYAPFARLRVKVVDAESEERLWPAADADTVQKQWYTLEYSKEVRTGELPRTTSQRAMAEQDFADQVGRALGNVFLKHETRERNERLGD